MGIDQKYLNRQITSADPEDSKSSARFVTTTALDPYNRVGNVITMTGNGAMPDQDGVTPAQGDSLLVTSDGSASDVDNGIYVVTQLGDGGNPTILTRRDDANADDLVTSGLNVRIEEGLVNATSVWVLVTANPIVVNTTALVLTKVQNNIADDVVDSSVQTTDATQTTLASYAPPLNSRVYSFRTTVLARAGDGEDSLKAVILTRVDRDSLATITIKGDNLFIFYESDQPSWAVTLDVSGADVRVRGTGEAGKEIEWRTIIEVLNGNEAFALP